MTKPVPPGTVPKPQFRSADYSLRYQVMLDTLNSNQSPGVTPLQLNVSPPGVNDLNRPMLINTTASRWRDLGLGSSITRPKYQRRRIGEPASKEQLERQMRKEEDLLAMSRLLQEATGSEKENLNVASRVASGVGEKGHNVKRSRSEPMHLPPIDEGQTPPGFRKPATPIYAQSRSRAGMSPGYTEAVNRRQHQRSATASRADSRTALPTLSKVKEEKNRYVDSSFLRGVQRHTGRLNMNLAMGKPPRAPRHSWEDGRARSSVEQHPTAHPPSSQQQNPHYNNDPKPAEPCEAPLRLRDMDLGVFPIRKKMESVRQWHEEQFRKHMEMWKQSGNSEPTDKHAEALELLAKYKQRDNRIPDILQTMSAGHSRDRRHSPVTQQNQNNTDSSVEPDQGAHNQRPTTPKVLPPPRTSHSNRKVPLEEGDTQEVPPAETGEKTPRVARALLDMDWAGLNLKPIKGAKPQKQEEEEKDEYVYKDARSYIEDNDLLPPDKCRRIQDWVNRVDLTSDCSSACSSPSGYSLTSNCSTQLHSDDYSEVFESAVQ